MVNDEEMLVNFLLKNFVAPKGAVCLCKGGSSLLAACVLGDSLSSLTDGVFGQLAGEKETDSCLDLPGGDGRFPVVVSQTGSLASDTLEDVIDKGVHNVHGLAGNTSVGMNLLHHLVDVDRITFFPPPSSLLLVYRFLSTCLLTNRFLACCHVYLILCT